MVVYSTEFELDTEEENQIIDISLQVRNAVKASKIKNGLVNVFVSGATGAIITMEYEPRLIEDTCELLEKLIPKGIGYKHDSYDDNAHSHLRASLLSPELTVPVKNGKPSLGTWQQIVFLELDTRGRHRNIQVTVTSE
ncbi:MAG: secondary thiamine-phosphate synthase enzyme YjbQ [Asgard group archaeon]|nr:secondary thiamine-phosphate synthase enzyme YjbQ [Asgard group archaeon]